MEGDEDAQTVLRYVIYQLVANGSPRDHTVSIGALGLTHTRYKGCYFWGTDLFLTPFYNLTNPRATRSLANFRVGTLPQAKAHAARMNGAGARYPWMLSSDSSEQCESWDISGDEASYHQVCFDWLQRYQVIKQADALLLMTRLPEQFTGKERLAA